MKILFISSRLPHANVVSGHQIVYQRIRRLAERGHQVGLATVAQPDDVEHVDEMKKLVVELEIQPGPRRPNMLHRLARRLASPIPSRFRPHYSPALFRCVGDMVERTRYDVAIAEYGLMGQYLNRNPYLPAVRKVISVHHCHTISSGKTLDVLGYAPTAMAEWCSYRKLLAFEFEMYRCADRILVLTPEERYGMLGFAPDLRVTVIPSGVDTERYRPADDAGREEAIVFTGYYSDKANSDAALWFSHAVWPMLKKKHPKLLFYVVGPEPTHAMLDLARRDPGILVTGWVEDIRPYLAKARVFVCPNRLGSGMRGKILQAMASGVPVVATTLGAEGIPIQMGNDGFLADRPRIMAQYINLLLGDPALREDIARRARTVVVERFSWDRGIDALENALREVVALR